MNETRSFPPCAEFVAEARRFVRDSLRGLDEELVDDGVLLVSEVAANVVEHAQTSYEVNVTVNADWVRIEVLDSSSVIPAVRDLAVDADRGRGLSLLQALSTSWGVEERGPGKSVWFELGGPEPS